jgi:hypothetical protein
MERNPDRQDQKRSQVKTSLRRRGFPEACTNVRQARSLGRQCRDLEGKLRTLQQRLRSLEQPPKSCSSCPFAVAETCEPFWLRKEQIEAAIQAITEAGSS